MPQLAPTIATAWQFAQSTIWPAAVSFVTSQPFTSAIVALSGAFFGAKTAQGTAERNRAREDFRKEMRNTNASISLSMSVCRVALALKRQHVRPMKASYEAKKAALLEHQQKRATGQIQGNKPFEVLLDLKVLHVPKFSTDILRTQVLDRLSTTGRPLNLAIVIDEEATALREVMAALNDIIRAAQQAGKPLDDEFISRYFGLPIKPGQVDETIPNLLDGIASKTDHVIFFSKLLCEDLIAHGNELLAKNRKLGAKGLQPLTAIDFSDVEQRGLIPNSEEYADWLKGFRRHPEPPPSLWKRPFLAIRLNRK